MGEGITGRITLADLLGLFIIFSALLMVFMSRKWVAIVPVPFILYLPFIIVLVIGVVFSDYPVKGLMVVLIHI